jgi:hypothetical protein
MSFSRYATDDSVISSEAVVAGLWSNGSNTLTTFFSASNSTEYYVNVYNTGSALSGSTVQFAIQYGNVSGSGSRAINANASTEASPSRLVYGEYRNLVFGTETTNFAFNNNLNTTSQDFFAINFSRARYKESIYPGSLQLTLSGSGGLLVLTDDSTTTTQTRFIGENRYFNVVATGSLTGTSYGYLFPDLDLITLDCTLLNNAGVVNLPTRTSNTLTNNALLLFSSIVSGSSFKAQSQETISSRYFFTRIKNSEFNYTTNPSIIDNAGNLIYNTLVNSPQTYITCVGMYNDNNELLAVAKLSKPLVKDFTKEALIRIKLDY